MFAKTNTFELKTKTKTRTVRCELLTQPNIPKPLHGLNPRTVLGKEWWDKTRFKSQADYYYRCAACGVHKDDAKEHQWLEGHEAWDINYDTGICEVTEIVPLCHYCHNFIHSGRLVAIIKCADSRNKAKAVLAHGFGILGKVGLRAFPGTIYSANLLHVDTMGVKPNVLPDVTLPWPGYKMKLEGKLYDSLYPTYEDWLERYK